MERLSYSAMMGENPIHLVLNIKTKEPIELGDFVGAFTSLAKEYERYIRANHPDLRGDAQIYVKEVRKGSIEADLIPWLTITAPFISQMDQALIVEEFVKLWGRRIHALISGDLHGSPRTKNELKDFANAVAAIARDPDASSELSAAVYEDKERKVRAAFKFDTKQAKEAERSIERGLKDMDDQKSTEYERIMMIFTRVDIRDAKIGKPSGEMVRIESISDKPLMLAYGSQMSEDRIKHEIREAQENIFYKGFMVDANVELRDGKPVAYTVVNVHQVLDLPDEGSTEA